MRFLPLALSIVCSLLTGFSSVSLAGYVPPGDNDGKRERAASGSRGGCPVELGAIELVAKNPARLETSIERPTLLYRVAVDTPTDFLLTVADLEDRQVFEYGARLLPGPSKIVPVTVDRLEAGRKYYVTAGLVCVENAESTKVIVSGIERVARTSPNDIDALARQYLEKLEEEKGRSVN